MIARLKGIVDGLDEGWLILDVTGVGYLIFCSSRTLGRLNIGDAIQLEIETHVREDHIHLYGFFDLDEKKWFNLLTTVQGVGAKVGLGLLSVLTGDELVHAIAAQDKTVICRANGVGPKLAVRILTELKDKAGALMLGAASRVQPEAAGQVEGVGTHNQMVADAASALVNLGYPPSDALAAVTQAAAKLADDGSVEMYIRGALNELAPGGNK